MNLKFKLNSAEISHKIKKNLSRKLIQENWYKIDISLQIT